MAFVPTNMMIPDILNPIMEYLQPSEAEIEDCDMRKMVLPLAGNAQRRKKPPGIFRFYSSISTYKKVAAKFRSYCFI